MVKQYRYCLKCGRKLKSEEARIRGYGDICFKRLRASNTCFLFDMHSGVRGNKKYGK